MLGHMPRARRGLSWWLLPAVDFLSSSTALTIIAVTAEARLFPALPLAPLLLVVVYGALGVYGIPPSRGTFGAEDGVAWPVIRLLVAALFVWSASLITHLSVGSELALWAVFVLLDTIARAIARPLQQRVERPERWVLVGDAATGRRLRAYEPLRSYATIVHTVPLADNRAELPSRAVALKVVDHCHADRVVIGAQHADDDGLLSLVRAFRSVGVPVSLLPRPLDLLEAPAATPNTVGGVPLIEVEALAAHDSVPYRGPDRRGERRTRVSVVIPAINEAENIGKVLSALPDGLHEVILVDGNSQDGTVEAACRAYPSIRVLTQSGRGKGDALRTGFAAVTGNLVVMLDADGSADPAEIPRFVEALEKGADFAKGSRFLEGGGSADITPLRRLGNTFLSGSANLLHGTRFTDLCYGYNAFWVRCLPFISLDAPGFEVETLIVLRIASAGMRISEVPSYEENRMYGQSNLKTFRDGFRVLGTIIGEARRRRSIRPERVPVHQAEAQKAETTTSAA